MHLGADHPREEEDRKETCRQKGDEILGCETHTSTR
jgi:hypothetical protein